MGWIKRLINKIKLEIEFRKKLKGKTINYTTNGGQNKHKFHSSVSLETLQLSTSTTNTLNTNNMLVVTIVIQMHGTVITYDLNLETSKIFGIWTNLGRFCKFTTHVFWN